MTQASDVHRELAKIEDTLAWAIRHHEKTNEANAALHLNEKVFPSPLTIALGNARTSVELVRVMLPDMCACEFADAVKATINHPEESTP